MPIWERTYLERAVSLDDSGADSWNLPKSGFLSSLIVKVEAQNDSLHNRNNQIWEHLDKIEVVHRGTEVIKSLKYCEPHALNVLDTRQMPRGRRRENASEINWETFFLNFGCYPGDLLYGLDLSRLIDPKFKLEWDLDLTTDGTLDQFETGSLKLDLITYMLREGPVGPLKGYIKSSEIDQWTGAHDVEHKVEVPIGNDYRRIMVRSYLSAYEMYYGLWYNELELNRGTRIPFKMYGKDWLDNDNVLNEYHDLTHEIVPVSGGKYSGAWCYPYSNFGKIDGYGAVPAGVERTADNATVSGGEIGFELRSLVPAAAPNEQARVLVSGIAPFSCLCIPFDKPSMDFNLKSIDYTDIDLKITSHYVYMAAEALQDIRVVLEEVIKG